MNWTVVVLPGRVDVCENDIPVYECNSPSLGKAIVAKLMTDPFEGRITGRLAVDRLLYLNRKGKVKLSE